MHDINRTSTTRPNVNLHPGSHHLHDGVRHTLSSLRTSSSLVFTALAFTEKSSQCFTHREAARCPDTVFAGWWALWAFFIASLIVTLFLYLCLRSAASLEPQIRTYKLASMVSDQFIHSHQKPYFARNSIS